MLSGGAPIALIETLAAADPSPGLGRIGLLADALADLSRLAGTGSLAGPVIQIGPIVLALFTSALLTCTVRWNPGRPECPPPVLAEPSPGSHTGATQFQSDCNVG